ncbi:hypothetical protein B9Y78_15705 [Stenotrophomonas maltophilia]|nr:hypothetical protein [Stenotrophomonas maltophilia]PJL37339.1 hypothetical protein B9Y78_15705 [Stenotrophomonas maltophilia]
MDAAAKPPRTGLRRPPQPDPPRHPTECTLLPLMLPASGRHYRGAGRSPADQAPQNIRLIISTTTQV